MIHREYFNQGNAGEKHSTLTVYERLDDTFEFSIRFHSANTTVGIILNEEQLKNLAELITGKEVSKLWKDVTR